MSVINSVLRDLDRKPSAFTPLEVDTFKTVGGKKKGSGLYWGVAPIIVFLIAIVFYWVYYNVDKQHRSTQQVETPSKKLEQSQEVLPPVPRLDESGITLQQMTPARNLDKNQISGLQIRENEEFMELEFQLTKFSPSFLKQRSNNRYVFVIKKVENSIATPVISDSPWLKQIQLSTSGNDIEIRFDTQQGVLVDTQDRREEAAYYWLIRLKKSLDVVETPAVAVKENNPSTSESSLMNTQPVQLSSQSIQTDPQTIQKEDVSVSPVKLQIRPVQNKQSEKMKLNAAIQSAKSGDMVTARKELEMLLGGEFDRPARTQLLDVLSKQNDGKGFAGLLSKSLKKYPQDQVLLLYEANRLFSEKQYLTLIEKFKTHIDNDQLLSLLATSYQRTDQHQLAEEYFILALKINPQQPRLWISLAISQQNLSQQEQALNSYQMALRSGVLNQRLHNFVQSKIKQLSN